MISRDEAKELLFSHLQNDNLRKHCLATAIIMESLANKLGHDADTWYITGLLHDIDLEHIDDDFSRHGHEARNLLKDADITEEMMNAIVRHSGNEPIQTLLDKALWIADPVNGLIVAAALMRPDKKISTIKLKSLKKKYKSKAFAAGVDREQIASCSNLGFELDEYLQLALDSLSAKEQILGFGGEEGKA